jgi:hypothetical protein
LYRAVAAFYVQRIIEGIQVYRAQFGNGKPLLIEADLHRGTLPPLKQMATGGRR